MLKKTDILSNAVTLAVTGTKISIISSAMMYMHHRKVNPDFLCALDRRLKRLQGDFIISEKRHLMLCSLIDM